MGTNPGGADLARSGLQDELKKKLPFESPEQEAMLNLARTNDTFELAFVRLFRSHKISPPQYNILRILRGAGGEGLPCLEIAGRMVTCVPDITRLIDRLERAGLVARTRSERIGALCTSRSWPRGSSCSGPSTGRSSSSTSG